MKLFSPNVSTIQRDLTRLLQDTGDVLAARAKEEPKLKEAVQFLDRGLSRARNAANGAVDYSRDVARNTDDYVHDSPWQAIGGALAVGVVIGMLLTRR